LPTRRSPPTSGARQPKRLVMLKGGHFDAYVADFDAASGAARDWFREHLLSAAKLSVPSRRPAVDSSVVPEDQDSGMEEPTVPLSSDVIRVLKKNPKRPGSMSYKRFSVYVDGMTVAQYFDAVRAQIGASEVRNCTLDLQFDSDPERGYIRIERDGRPVSVRRSPAMSYGRRRA